VKPRGGEGQNGWLKCPMGFLVVYNFDSGVNFCGENFSGNFFAGTFF